MPRLILAPAARRDLREIRDHIAGDDPGAAHRVVRRIRDLADMLAAAPAMGRNRPELGHDLRSFVADRYVLFYRPLEGDRGIEVARVLHGARDVQAILLEDQD